MARQENIGKMDYIEQAIKGGVGSGAFDVLRKLAALATMLLDSKQTPETAATEADGAVFGQALAFQVGKGNLSAEEAANNVADRKAAAWIPLARVWLAEQVQKGFVALGGWLGAKVGNPELGAKIGENIDRFLNSDIQKLIEKGLLGIQKAAPRIWGWTKQTVGPLFAKIRDKLFA